MKPKNSKARRTSFLKFLALFLVTVTMIMTAVYFNYQVPIKENALLNEEAKLIKGDTEFQSSFYDEMKKIKSMIDSLDTPGTNVPYLNGKIGTKLAVVQQSVPSIDSTHLHDMHMSIIDLYSDLQSAKTKLLKLSDADNRIKNLEAAYKDCQTDLRNAENNLRQLDN